LQGLRLHDNPALLDACTDVDHMFPIFILDPHFLDPQRVGAIRMQFLLDSLTDLDASLKARGSRLLLLQGNPTEVLPKLIQEWKITKLCFESDTEPYALVRDAAIKQQAITAGVSVHSFVSHTLYDPAELIKSNGGKPPITMKAFEKLIALMGDPPAPAIDPPAVLPAIDINLNLCSTIESLIPTSLATLPGGKYTAATEHATATTPFRGGESVALSRMAEYLSDTNWVATFEKPKGNPATFTPRPATTVLSPYLKFGCLSPRLFHAKLQSIYKEKKGKHTQPPVSLRGQLLWREFFYTVSFGTPNFDKMLGNALCRQMPWVDNQEFLKAWEDGKTGYPWIDAIMTQLKQEGWMHHLARHSVACFLTRGDLYCSWEAGRDVFDRLLIDADWALNAGNWMWLSASAFFNQYFRVYSPIAFGKQYDKNGDYIKRYLPVLKDMPAKYIYEPWTAPMAVQEKANCIIGKDYPKPIVDHAVVMKVNMQKMKAAYAAGNIGSGGVDGGIDGGPVAKKAKKN
jgi:cryptochrome